MASGAATARGAELLVFVNIESIYSRIVRWTSVAILMLLISRDRDVHFGRTQERAV
jgi:hypothetical protein